jgi:hypothetical protein
MTTKDIAVNELFYVYLSFSNYFLESQQHLIIVLQDCHRYLVRKT